VYSEYFTRTGSSLRAFCTQLQIIKGQSCLLSKAALLLRAYITIYIPAVNTAFPTRSNLPSIVNLLKNSPKARPQSAAVGGLSGEV